ncbi:MAG: stage V sporulation protein AC [Clostridia bacterium]|nr:stage V sporulation protein AC [Clostridia bacterium]
MKEREDSVKEKGRDFNDVNMQNYKSYVFAVMPKSKHFKNIILAFVVGGLICVIGQLIIEFFVFLGVSRVDATGHASSCLIVIAAILTGLGVYDKIGRFAGAGSTIPITGFSNAVVAPAIEYRCEGLIYGVGTRMFFVAGPVIVNGVSIAIVVALVRWLFFLYC